MPDKSQLDALKALDALQGTQAKQTTPKTKPAEAKPRPDTSSKKGTGTKQKNTGKKHSPILGDISIGKLIGKTLRGDMFDSTLVRRQIGLIMLLCLFGIVLVFMRYQVESLQKDKIATQKRIDYLNEHKIDIRKQYQQAVMPSTIAEALKDEGIGTMSGPPYEL